MLQSGGQAFDAAIKAGATKEQALTNGLFNALLNLSEGIGLKGSIDKVALKSFAAQTVKEAVLGGVENFGQGVFPGLASDMVRQLTYDPKSKTFSTDNLIKNLKGATISSLMAIATGPIRSKIRSRKNIAENDSGNLEGDEYIDAYHSGSSALKSPAEVLKQLPSTIPIDTNPVRTLPESTVDASKAPNRIWAREAIANKRSNDAARLQAPLTDPQPSTPNPNALQPNAPTLAITNPPKAGETLIKAPKEFFGTIRINPDLRQDLLEAIRDLPKPDLRTSAREAVSDWRSNGEARRQAESEELQRSTASLDALESETGQSDATNPVSTDTDEEPLYKSLDIHAQLPEKLKDKTVATVGKFQTLSGWSPKRSEAFTSVDPLDILKYSEQIGHPIKKHKFDQGVPGQFYASHAERQAALLHSGIIEIHPHPMCPDCVAWFRRHAASTKKQWVVRDPKNINIFYSDGSLKQIPVKGKTVK